MYDSHSLGAVFCCSVVAGKSWHKLAFKHIRCWYFSKIGILTAVENHTAAYHKALTGTCFHLAYVDPDPFC